MQGALAPAEGFLAYLAEHEHKSLLRFITCGSVDDGKSTLIGRLLFDSKLIFEDQLASLEKDSRRHGTVGDDIDFALLVDGLSAEREQGITIDVAYRFFATDKRKFIVADTPGHVQYTRNMATGASTADLAVILVDARQGLLTQTRRHSFIVSLLGIRHVILAINKIDLVGFDQGVFERIAAEYRDFAADFGFESLVAVPLSARYGDNVMTRSPNTLWYQGPTLLERLETVEVSDTSLGRPFRLAVQWVNRPNLDFRGFSGTISSGSVRPGDPVVVARSGRTSRVRAIVTHDGDLAEAGAGEAVTLTLEDEIDISRGDVLAPPDRRPQVSDQFAASVLWMAEDALLPGRPYLLKIGTRTVTAQVTEIRHQVDVDSFQKLAARTLRLNEVGEVDIATSEAIAFDPYADDRATGAFILIDRASNLTVGAGMIRFGRHRAQNVHWQALAVTQQGRAGLKGQKPAVLWFTGLSGAGKSTVADLVERRLHALGRHTYLLDGDNLRHGLTRDLGFTDADRAENIRRVGEAAKLFVDAGLIVLVSLISPFRADRQAVRERLGDGEFIEIHVDTPLAVAESRDPKGLYRKARDGRIANFTGVDSPYEPPEAPEIRISTETVGPQDLAERIVAWLAERRYLG
jgi:bifunctional enzyme CysN/CysC